MNIIQFVPSQFHNYSRQKSGRYQDDIIGDRRIVNQKKKAISRWANIEQNIISNAKSRRQLKRRERAKEILAIKRRQHLSIESHDYFPAKQYLLFANFSEGVANSTVFNSYILVCIVTAGVLVGIQTVPSLQDLAIVVVLDNIVLYSFATEVVCKIIAQGLAPHLYFFGRERMWNNFDFLIVLFSIPWVLGGTSGNGSSGKIKLLRLLRLLRLAKVFRKVPELRLIITGLAGGIESVLYIMMLLFVIIYVFAVGGLVLFRENDPWHWNSLGIASLTLLRTATLDNWGDILFINYFGCDVYSNGYYTNIPVPTGPANFGIFPAYCERPLAQPWLSTLFFGLFIFTESFVILSLFIGTITIAMAKNMIKQRLEKSLEIDPVVETRRRMETLNQLRNEEMLDPVLRRKVKLLKLGFSGKDVHQERLDSSASSDSVGWFLDNYIWIGYKCRGMTDSRLFQNLVTLTIVGSAVSVAVSTDSFVATTWASEIKLADILIQSVFTAEIFFKVVAEGVRPWRFFSEVWNAFDVIIVCAAWVNNSNGSVFSVVYLRLVRLLRVLKVLHVTPQLQVIVSAILKGVKGVFFVSILLVISFYFFGIIAMTFIEAENPVQFGSLAMTMLTLLDSATLDAWSNVMYVSMYGCHNYAGMFPRGCNSDAKAALFAPLYWIVFVNICSFVVLTLFIGIVSIEMEESKHKQWEEMIVSLRAADIADFNSIDAATVSLYKEIFDLLDVDLSETLGKSEMKFGFDIAGLRLNDAEFQLVWNKMDKDNSNGVDFAEFLGFLLDVREELSEKALSRLSSGINILPRASMRASMKRETYSELTDKLKVRNRLAKMGRPMSAGALVRSMSRGFGSYKVSPSPVQGLAPVSDQLNKVQSSFKGSRKVTPVAKGFSLQSFASCDMRYFESRTMAAIQTIQRYWKGSFARRKYAKAMSAIRLLQRFCKRWLRRRKAEEEYFENKLKTVPSDETIFLSRHGSFDHTQSYPLRDQSEQGLGLGVDLDELTGGDRDHQRLSAVLARMLSSDNGLETPALGSREISLSSRDSYDFEEIPLSSQVSLTRMPDLVESGLVDYF